MNGQDLINKVEDFLEPEVISFVDQNSKRIVDLILDQVKALIPGPFDDVAIEAAKPKLEQMVHDKLIELANKISPRV